MFVLLFAADVSFVSFYGSKQEIVIKVAIFASPHDILEIHGEKALQAFLLNEVQEVYRAQGVTINDKHIETIIRQMMRWVQVTDVGDTPLIVEEKIDKHRFKEINERAVAAGGAPATCEPQLLGITKAALTSESFIKL